MSITAPSSPTSNAVSNVMMKRASNINGTKETADAAQNMMRIAKRQNPGSAKPNGLSGKLSGGVDVMEAQTQREVSPFRLNTGVGMPMSINLDDIRANALKATLQQAGLESQLQDLRQGAQAEMRARKTTEIMVLTEEGLEQSISDEDAARELREVKEKCQKISRMKGQIQLDHCLALLRGMSDLMTDEAKTFVHGWGCYILSHF